VLSVSACFAIRNYPDFLHQKRADPSPENTTVLLSRIRAVGGKNIWSKRGENPVKSRVYADFSVEKTVENVKTYGVFSPLYRGETPCFPPYCTLLVENYCGKVVNSGENP